MFACAPQMGSGPLQIAREKMRQREIFFAHIAAQAAAQRRATTRRHIAIGVAAVVLLIAAAIFLPH
jgi:hypothetical protein